MLKISENVTRKHGNPKQLTVQWEFSCCAREYASFELLVCRNLAEVSFSDVLSESWSCNILQKIYLVLGSDKQIALCIFLPLSSSRLKHAALAQMIIPRENGMGNLLSA